MDDRQIICLLPRRSEQGLEELAKKYGPLCTSLARHILHSERDAEECVNDAYLAAWNTIPPQNPDPLQTYLCRLTRNIAVTRYHANRAAKRGNGYTVCLDELEGCLASLDRVEEQLEAQQLAQAINGFLASLDRESRVLLLRRYWYADSMGEIGKRLGISGNVASVRLFRLRKKLKQYLREKGMME